MISTFHRLDPRRKLISVAILLLGLGSALVIFLTAPLEDTLAWDPADSKQYLRQMETYGGKGNELATELRLWFGSLWHGERLAVTVACITLVVFFGYLFASTPQPAEAGTLHDIKQDRKA